MQTDQRLDYFKKQYDRFGYVRAVGREKWNSLVVDRKLKKDDNARLARINGMEEKLKEKTPEQLQAMSHELKMRVRKEGATVDEIIEPAFALLREASRRVVGLRHYDVQVLAGLALVRGAIAQMATGEGKTLGVTLPSYVFAMMGKGVHVITVNSYLAKRDYEFVQPIMDFLGISIGLLPENAPTDQKRRAYQKEITYGVGYEFGFDYLRDQLTLLRWPTPSLGENLRLAILGHTPPKPVLAQRDLAYAIVDEVDSVLIDEAGTPLLISEPAKSDKNSEKPFFNARDVAQTLAIEEDFTIEARTQKLEMTDAGRENMHRNPELIPWNELRRPWSKYVENAVKAEFLFKKDVHYVIKEEKVVIVDEFTGRRFEDRSWREGLHQAVQAKENVPITPENESVASISRQRCFRLYDLVCGLTGTAAESAGEFWHFYSLPVQPIPLNRPLQRKVMPTRAFKDKDSMYDAIVSAIHQLYKEGQPVLVGTRTIEVSEALAVRLEEAMIPYRLLNAKQDEEEEEIIHEAGQKKTITLATNMAGRGAHIPLGPGVEDLGGLHVIAVEYNESRRIDRQLIGRSARQGQPGSCQTFVSADDFIMERYSPETQVKLKGMKTDKLGEYKSDVIPLFDKVQDLAERVRYDSRLKLARHDKWLEETKHVTG